MLKEKFDYSAAAGWRDLIWVRVNYWDAEGSMAKSEVLLFTQWRLLAAFRKSWLFKLWRLQGNIRRAWLNLCAHEVSLICSRINLVKKILRWESVNLKSFQVWRSPVSGEFIAFQWGSWEKQWHCHLVWICGEILCKPPSRLWFMRGQHQQELGWGDGGGIESNWG